jgi:hypothetical protein
MIKNQKLNMFIAQVLIIGALSCLLSFSAQASKYEEGLSSLFREMSVCKECNKKALPSVTSPGNDTVNLIVWIYGANKLSNGHLAVETTCFEELKRKETKTRRGSTIQVKSRISENPYLTAFDIDQSSVRGGHHVFTCAFGILPHQSSDARKFQSFHLTLRLEGLNSEQEKSLYIVEATLPLKTNVKKTHAICLSVNPNTDHTQWTVLDKYYVRMRNPARKQPTEELQEHTL